MRARSERGIFKEIRTYSPDEIRATFLCTDRGSAYCFYENKNPKHWVTVDKRRTEGFWVPVNADFDFARPAGSNNYPELIDVGQYLASVFGAPLYW